MSEKYGFVYLWLDRKHKRYYVGSHWGHEEDGYVCSSPWMKRAYKLRCEDFDRKILARVDSREDLYLEETRWLSMIKESEISPNTPNPRYYNLHIKGAAHWSAKSEDRRSVSQRISEATKGIPKPKSEEHRKAMSESQKGKTHVGRVLSKDHRKKISDGNVGKKMPPRSEEYKVKQRASHLGKPAPNKGVPQSPEALTKFRETLRLKKLRHK